MSLVYLGCTVPYKDAMLRRFSGVMFSGLQMCLGVMRLHCFLFLLENSSLGELNATIEGIYTLTAHDVAPFNFPACQRSNL